MNVKECPTELSVNLLLQPGQVIKPQLNVTNIREVVERLYGLRVKVVTELDSYDDKNFLVEVEDNFSNQHIQQLSSDGYVLKVINSLDSGKPQVIDAQTELMIYMLNQGLVLNTPIKNITGNYKSLETIGVAGQKHLIRLVTFLPGKIFCDVPCTRAMCRQIGELAAKFDAAAEGFNHPIYESIESVWMLHRASDVWEFIDAVDSEERQQMIKAVLVEFDRDVLKNVDKFPKGLIHGDMNEHNLIVRQTMATGEYEVYGIIDFGDTHKNCYVFEVAIAAAYCMLLGANASEWIDFSGHVIAGYATKRMFTPMEWNVMKICMEARLCQSLVMGAYTYRQDPTNVYVLTTAHKGWQVLEWLRITPYHIIYDKWNQLMSEKQP